MKNSAQSVDQALTLQPDKLPDPISRYSILDLVEPLPFRPMDALLLIVVGLAIVAAITIAVVALVVYLVKR